MEKINLKSGTEKKIVFRGQFTTRGLNSRSLTIRTLDSNTKRYLKKILTNDLVKNIELSFVDSGQHVDLKLIDKEKIKERADDYGRNPTVANNRFVSGGGSVSL
jgi:predicted DNA-binding antitoxin AbrB/MazE fold protein